MAKRISRRVFALVLSMAVLTAIVAGCAELTDTGTNWPVYKSYRDIPGVNQGHISAISELQKSRNTFNFSSIYGNEMFVAEDGRIRGFTAHLCNWLSELFEIPFVPSIVEWDEMIEGMASGAIDFTSELTATFERRQTYHMTDGIAQRQVITIRMDDAPPLAEIAERRTLRYGFLDGCTFVSSVARAERADFDIVLVENNLHAYELLRNRQIDAFFNESSAEAAFGFFTDIVTTVYYPIIYSTVSLSTQDSELRPIIDVVNLALQNDAIHHLIELYNLGYQEYLTHKFFMLITDEEREFMRNNPVIPFAAEITNYPISFFETRTGEWEGIAIDVVAEMEKVTGLTFERINDENSYWYEMLAKLESGEVSMISSLIQSDDRIGLFTWPHETFFNNSLALVSKSEFRNISMNEIMYVNVGVIMDAAHGKLFMEWFPHHRYVTEYVTTYDAFDALVRGDIDMVMVSEHQLLILTNYRELVGYKANFVFDYQFDSTYGINVNEELLASIVTKAMIVIDVDGISNRWLRMTYDYRVQLAQERIPFFVGGGILTAGLIFTFILFYRKRKEGQHLESVVAMRTSELSEAVEVAQEASRAKSDFLSSMSHEIRTPMNAIIGMAELLGHEQLNDRQRGYVGDIAVSSKSLLGIINDILDFSKVESGKLELNPVDYEPKSLIDNVDSMFSYVARQKGLEFITETLSDIPDAIFGDDIRVRQILTNICGNAVKFTEKGSIRLSVIQEGEMLVFKIKDSGMGIHKEDLPKLFKAFEQLDKVKNRSVVGTGLGLSITKAFVEMMGGEISVESEYGFGTTFSVAIPIVKGDATKIRRADIDIEEYSISAPDARILVTDDNEFNLRVASGLLNFMDIEAELADSGRLAIELVKRNDYDIVFMDHMMPEMDGVETVQEIRKLGGKFEELTIIALSANAVQGSREMFLENSFNDFISKPIDTQELQEMVQRYLPPEKVKTVEKSEGDTKEMAAKEDQLRKKAIVTFVNENRGTFEKISAALISGDIKTAHRIAHTLKSSAGYLGKKELQEAAFSLEMSLKDEPAETSELPLYTNEQLDAIEKGLASALEEFEPIAEEAMSEKIEAVEIDDDQLKALLDELRPLLETSDFSATDYVEKLQGIAGMEKIVEQIDDYNFEGALEELNKLSDG
jgi:signal transduction histidine kinase/CheY-like chemotaxis protein/HPt (histidine-containing phosphotransfer) domain-containing protein